MIIYFDNYSKTITNDLRKEMTVDQAKKALDNFEVKDYNEPFRILKECDFDFNKADKLIKIFLEDR